METRRDKNVKLDLKLELQKPNINRSIYILFLGNVSHWGHFFFFYRFSISSYLNAHLLLSLLWV